MDQFPYNQYNNNNTSSYGPAPEKMDSFAAASIICGMISIILCWTGLFYIPAGALGILFAILSKRTNKPMPRMSLTGIILSCIGIAMGVLVLIFSLYKILTDPELRKIFEDLSSSPNGNPWFLIN